jgi:hypothetical protein
LPVRQGKQHQRVEIFLIAHNAGELHRGLGIVPGSAAAPCSKA